MKHNTKFIIPFSAQLLILIFCFMLQIKISSLSPTGLVLITYSAYIIFGVGIVLSIWFNRSRMFFLIVLLTICQLTLSSNSSFFANFSDFLRILYPVICILLPSNIALFSQFKDNGIFSPWGKAKFVFIAFQIYLVFMYSVSGNQAAIEILNYRTPILGNWGFQIALIPLIFYCIYLFFFAIKTLKSKSSYDMRILVILLCVFISLSLINSPAASSLYLSASGFILILGILEASYTMAYLDELTGISSRRALKEDLMKLGSKYVIAMIDVDMFKGFNDTYGHDVGDEVLKLIAKKIEKVTGGGKAYRYGGEEFSIIFPGKTLPEVIPHLDKLRELVANSGYSKINPKTGNRSKKKLYVTISIGAAEKNSNCRTTDEVMSAADKALYRAKEKGRNCVSK